MRNSQFKSKKSVQKQEKKERNSQTKRSGFEMQKFFGFVKQRSERAKMETKI